MFFGNVVLATESKMEYRTKSDIKGNPKTIMQIHYKSINLTDTLTKEDVDYAFFSEINKKGYVTVSRHYISLDSLLEKSVYLYNKRNDLVDVSFYDSAENLKWKRAYVYNKKGKLTEREDICKDSSCYEKEIYKHIGNVTSVYFYDIDGKLKYYTENYARKNNKIKLLYSSDGKLLSKEQYEFDKKGNILKYSRYNGENYLQDEQIYEYDKNGNLLGISLPTDFLIKNRKSTYKYDDRGYLSEYAYLNYDAGFKFTYSYNEFGLLIEEICYKDEVLDSKTTYKYDSKGNWIEKTVYEKDNLKKVTQRQIDYYTI